MTEGVRRRRSLSAITSGIPESTAATSEFVVPRSIPTMRLITMLSGGFQRCLINCGAITRGWNRLAFFSSSLQPCGAGLQDLLQGPIWRFSECGARIEVRNVSDVTRVFFAKKDVDVVVRH